MNWMFVSIPPNPYVEVLTPSVIALEDEAFGSVWGLDGVTRAGSPDGISVLIRRVTRERVLSVSLPGKDTVRMEPYSRQHKGPHWNTTMQALILDFQPPELREHRFR